QEPAPGENPLDVLEGFVGKTWKGEVSPPGSEETLYDVSRWEWTLNRQAIRIRHSVGDGLYSGETLMTWDQRAGTVAYLYATTGGFFTRGTLRADDTFFEATEIVVGSADGILGVRSTGELLPDGTLRIISSSRKRTGWMDADTTIYVEDPDAQIIITGDE
ncbi:MAG: hypothetical protein HKN43_15245, partial [Rhodothermales bacterium]|nr:hypothetical protein [Rhodothermales bacterium]